MKCKCSHPLKDTDKFCSQCGEKVVGDIPKLLPESERNYKFLEKMAVSIIDGIVKNGRTDEDDAQYMYEEAMQAFYGKNIFDWINDNLD